MASLGELFLGGCNVSDAQGGIVGGTLRQELHYLSSSLYRIGSVIYHLAA